jgi:hypothetical protein
VALDPTKGRRRGRNSLMMLSLRLDPSSAEISGQFRPEHAEGKDAEIDGDGFAWRAFIPLCANRSRGQLDIQ